jgi:hypothetical protein
MMVALPSWLLVAAGLLIAGLGLLPLLLMGELRTLRQRIADQEGDLRALSARQSEQGTQSALTTEQRVRIERELDALRLRLDRVELGEGASQPYAQAVRLAQRGAGTAELVAECGLSRGEAELLVRLHGLKAAS